MSLSSGDEVPQIFTRKSRLQPGEFLITSAKRLLQQYLPTGDIAGLERDGGAAFCFGARMINIKGKLLSLNTAASNSAPRWIIFHKLYG